MRRIEFSLLLALAACANGPKSLTQGRGTGDAGEVQDLAGVFDITLDPQEAGGATYCLNPASAALRAAIKRQKILGSELFDSAALAADISALHEILRKQYAGYPELLQHRTFDVDRFFANWRQDLAQRSTLVPFEDGVIRQLIELKKVHPDRHLQPTGWAGELLATPELAVAEYQGPAPKGDLAACHVLDAPGVFPETLRKSAHLRSGGSEEIVTVSVLGASPPVLVLECDGERIPLQRRANLAARASQGLPAYELKSVGDVALITVRRLAGSPEDLKLLEQLPLDYERHQQHRALVFDFRGNGGGNDGYVFQWLERAKRGSFHMAPSVEIEGQLFPCRDWNMLVYSQIVYDTVDSQDGIAARAELQKSWPSRSPGINHRISSGVVTMEAEHPYKGKIYVLVDRMSLSSGESAPAALRSALGATLVGERTGGFLEYGNLQPFVLPRTGIVFWVPIVRRYYQPSAEQVGLEVDAYLDPQQLALPAEQLISLLPR